MSKKEMVGGVPGNVLGMLSDLMHKLQHGVRTPEQLDMFLKGLNPFETIPNLLAAWQSFYDSIDISVDLRGVRIPLKRKGFDRLIVVAQGITPQKAYDICSQLFDCWKYTDRSLDKVVDFDFQTRNSRGGAYAVWVRDRVEADKKLKNLSANQNEEHKIPGTQLEERLLYEAKYFKETGKHLDVRSWTLCTGSRYVGDNVPCVGWCSNDRGVFVDCYRPGYARGSLRSREVVS